jgi:lysophospholipase L1-like esterase
MKHILSNIIVAICTMLLCLLLGETVIRAMNYYRPGYDFEMWRYGAELKQPLPYPGLPFYHFPNREGRYYGIEIRMNSLGMRDDERTAAKPEGKKRIVFLGDSFTLGWGVPFESIITKQLEQMLNRTAKRYEVINMGVGNYNSSMEVELFKLKGLRLDPDMVVLMYFANDTEPTPYMNAFSYAVLRRSYLLGYLTERVKLLGMRGNPGHELLDYYRRIYSEGFAAREMNTEALRELVRLCRDRGIKLLMVNIPDLRRLRGYPFPFATDHIRRLAAEAQVPFLDLLPVFETYDERSLWVSPADPHMNAKANALAADAIYEKILREKLIAEVYTRQGSVNGRKAGM